jgi:hypothetical protein
MAVPAGRIAERIPELSLKDRPLFLLTADPPPQFLMVLTVVESLYPVAEMSLSGTRLFSLHLMILAIRQRR